MGKNWQKSGEKWKNSGRGRKHEEEKAKQKFSRFFYLAPAER